MTADSLLIGTWPDSDASRAKSFRRCGGARSGSFSNLIAQTRLLPSQTWYTFLLDDAPDPDIWTSPTSTSGLGPASEMLRAKRTEERRVGKEGVRKYRTGWAP